MTVGLTMSPSRCHVVMVSKDDAMSSNSFFHSYFCMGGVGGGVEEIFFCSKTLGKDK